MFAAEDTVATLVGTDFILRLGLGKTALGGVKSIVFGVESSLADKFPRQQPSLSLALAAGGRVVAFGSA